VPREFRACRDLPELALFLASKIIIKSVERFVNQWRGLSPSVRRDIHAEGNIEGLRLNLRAVAARALGWYLT
jgi:hypothetical protein